MHLERMLRRDVALTLKDKLELLCEMMIEGVLCTITGPLKKKKKCTIPSLNMTHTTTNVLIF